MNDFRNNIFKRTEITYTAEGRNLHRLELTEEHGVPKGPFTRSQVIKYLTNLIKDLRRYSKRHRFRNKVMSYQVSMYDYQWRSAGQFRDISLDPILPDQYPEDDPPMIERFYIYLRTNVAKGGNSEYNDCLYRAISSHFVKNGYIKKDGTWMSHKGVWAFMKKTHKGFGPAAFKRLLNLGRTDKVSVKKLAQVEKLFQAFRLKIFVRGEVDRLPYKFVLPTDESFETKSRETHIHLILANGHYSIAEPEYGLSLRMKDTSTRSINSRLELCKGVKPNSPVEMPKWMNELSEIDLEALQYIESFIQKRIDTRFEMKKCDHLTTACKNIFYLTLSDYPDKIDYYEAKLLTIRGGIIVLPTQSTLDETKDTPLYKYDIASAYPAALMDLEVPMTAPTPYTLDSLDGLMSAGKGIDGCRRAGAIDGCRWARAACQRAKATLPYGLYRVKMTRPNDPLLRKLVRYDEEQNIATHFDVMSALALGYKVELLDPRVEDSENLKGNFFHYKDRKSGLFNKYVSTLYDLKESQYESLASAPKDQETQKQINSRVRAYAKKILNTLWGTLVEKAGKQEIVRHDKGPQFVEITKENQYDVLVKARPTNKEDPLGVETSLTYRDPTKPFFRTSMARIGPFLTSYLRYRMVTEFILPFISDAGNDKKVIRIHTDGFTTTHPMPESLVDASGRIGSLRLDL